MFQLRKSYVAPSRKFPFCPKGLNFYIFLIEGKFGVDYCRLSENEELKVEKACFLL
jgi:hypothetical protein